MIVWFRWILSICEMYREYRTAGHLVFWRLWKPSWKTLTGSRAEKSVTKHGFVFWAQRKPNARLKIYKAFQDRLTFLNRRMKRFSKPLNVFWCIYDLWNERRSFCVFPALNVYFLYFCVLFSATAVLFDWIKFDVWNQVVLVSCYSRATVEPAWHGSSTTFETGLRLDRKRKAVMKSLWHPGYGHIATALKFICFKLLKHCNIFSFIYIYIYIYFMTLSLCWLLDRSGLHFFSIWFLACLFSPAYGI